MNYFAALFVPLTVIFTSETNTAHPLLAGVPTRAPVNAVEPVMSALTLEACVRRASKLDATGIAIGYEIAAIDRQTAEAMFLENPINAEIPALGGYDEPGLVVFQKRAIRHAILAKKSEAEFPLYQQKQKAYDAAVAEFGRDCAQGFTASELCAVNAKLGSK